MNKRFLKVDYRNLSNQLKKRGVKGVRQLSLHYLRNVREGVLKSESLLREINTINLKYEIDYAELSKEIVRYGFEIKPADIKRIHKGTRKNASALKLINELLEDNEMTIKEIKKIAAEKGVKFTVKVKKEKLIKDIQIAEGNDSCFNSKEIDICNENCTWYKDCKVNG